MDWSNAEMDKRPPQIEEWANADISALRGTDRLTQKYAQWILHLEASIEKLEAQSKFDRARIRILSQAYPNARINRDKIDEEIHILNLEEEQWRAQYKDRMQELQDSNIDLESRIDKLEHTYFCVYCDKRYESMTHEESEKVLGQHIKECQNHPLYKALARIEKLERVVKTAKELMAEHLDPPEDMGFVFDVKMDYLEEALKALEE